MKMTVNEAMVLQRTLKERVAELRNLRSSVATERTTHYPWAEGKEKIENVVVKYDIKALDKKVTQIELVLYKMDARIKQSNAVTELEVEADVDALMAPLE
jgi:hypothetical protein